MRLDVRGSQELRDIALALQAMETSARRVIRQHVKPVVQPAWLHAINRRARTVLEHRVISQTSTVAVSDNNVRVQSAAKGRRLSGGFNPKTDYAGVEFGANREQYTTYQRKGNPVRRRAARQLRPRNTKGYVFYPTAREMIPRLAALRAQTIVRLIGEILEGKEK